MNPQNMLLLVEVIIVLAIAIAFWWNRSRVVDKPTPTPSMRQIVLGQLQEHKTLYVSFDTQSVTMSFKNEWYYVDGIRGRRFRRPDVALDAAIERYGELITYEEVIIA